MVVPDLNGDLVVYFLAKRRQYARSRKNSIELLRHGRHRAKERGRFVGIEPHLFWPEYAADDGVDTACPQSAAIAGEPHAHQFADGGLGQHVAAANMENFAQAIARQDL